MVSPSSRSQRLDGAKLTCNVPLTKREQSWRTFNKGCWSDEEKRLFLIGLQTYGKGKWKQIGKVLTTRSSIQIKSHGQKILTKLDAGEDIFAESRIKVESSKISPHLKRAFEPECGGDGSVEPELVCEDTLRFRTHQCPPFMTSIRAANISTSTTSSASPLSSSRPRRLATMQMAEAKAVPTNAITFQAHFGASNPIWIHHDSDDYHSVHTGSLVFRSQDHRPKIDRANSGRPRDDVLAAAALCALSSSLFPARNEMTTESPLSSKQRNAFSLPSPTLQGRHVSKQSDLLLPTRESVINAQHHARAARSPNVVSPTEFEQEW